MKNRIITLTIAVALAGAIYFLFSNKPPRVSVFDELRVKLVDSLQYANGPALLDLHDDMLKSDGKAKTALLEELSSEWLLLGQPAVAADYLRQIADAEPAYESYMRAGAALSSLIDFETQDQVRVNLVYGARYCFEEALELNPGDIDARVGLASVLVGSNTPMEGIAMLRQVEAENPGNVKVNLELGKFSVMSGQFDKAIERFSAVLQKDSLNLQAQYMMAQAYLGMKDTTGAIETLEKVKTLTTDSLIMSQVQREINNLK